MGHEQPSYGHNTVSQEPFATVRTGATHRVNSKLLWFIRLLQGTNCGVSNVAKTANPQNKYIKELTKSPIYKQQTDTYL